MEVSLIILILKFHNVNRKVFTRMVMLSKKREVVVYCRSSSFASVLLGTVAAPHNSFRLAIRYDVFVAVVKQHFTAFRRLSKHQLLLAQLLAADDFLQDLRDVCNCVEKDKLKLELWMESKFYVMNDCYKVEFD